MIVPPLRVLVIDDEPALREILSAHVAEAGYEVEEASGAAEATAKLAAGGVDVALCDIKMSDGNGIDLLRDTRAAGIATQFIMVTGFGSLETAVEALRAGASDYITKPVLYEELAHRLSQIDAMRDLREENRSLRKAIDDGLPLLYQFTSPRMMELERLLEKVARIDSTILITGESGTGKGIVARRIHNQSERCDGPFLPVNCGAVPEHLLESEFFGHAKGAFTGADRAHRGVFLRADQGTLFLDEIGELPLHMQSKLLHIVEDKLVRPLGSEQVHRVDTRIIAATNSDLEARVRAGKFREDLYYRLSMFHLHVPPLRECREDLPGLIRFVLNNLKSYGKHSGQIEIDPLAEDVLLAYRWPGNVRELENVLTRAFVLSEGDCITVADLPGSIHLAADPEHRDGVATESKGYLRTQIRKLELEIVQRAIEEAHGDRKLAAQRLGIGVSSLYHKLEEQRREQDTE